MDTKLYLIGPKFSFSGQEGEMSSAHADLHDGELIKVGGVWRFSFNAFNPSAVYFCREGILVHSLLHPVLVPKLGVQFVFDLCPNGNVMYFPVFKNVSIDITQSMHEEISEIGIFEYFMRHHKIKSIPSQYYIFGSESLPKNIILRKTRPMVFGIYRQSNPASISIPENIHEIELWTDKGLWILNSRIYQLFQPYVDMDYYSVLEVSDKDLWH